MSAAAAAPRPDRVELQGGLTIVQAEAHREQLLAVLQAAEGSLVLDLSAIDAIDTAGVQLLLASRRLLHERGAELHIEQAPEAVRAVLGVYGLADLLGADRPRSQAQSQSQPREASA